MKLRSKAAKGVLLSMLAGTAACSQRPPETQTAAKREPGFALYGNFCGPGYPRTRSSSAAAELTELEAISARDDLDRYCKLHDLCYAETFHSNKVCDQEFVFRTRALAVAHLRASAVSQDIAPRLLHRACALAAGWIGDYFGFLHPSQADPVEAEKLRNRIGQLLAPFEAGRRPESSSGRFAHAPFLGCMRKIEISDPAGHSMEFIAEDGLD